MANRIEPNNDHTAGEKVIWQFDVRTPDDTDKPLTNPTIEWYLLDSRREPTTNHVLSHTDSNVTTRVVNEAEGILEVVLESGATEPFAGSEKWQVLIVQDDAGGKQVWNGRFPIEDR